MECKKCTHCPEVNFLASAVYIGVELQHLKNKLVKAFAKYKNYYEYKNYYLLKNVAFCELIENLVNDSKFNELEKQEIKILPLRAGESFDFSMFSQMQSLYYWETLVNSQDLLYVLKNNTLITEFQAIMNIQDNTIYGYEALSRGIDANGNTVAPNKLFAPAKAAGLLFNLDRQCRETVIKNASAKNISQKIFINFIPTSIYDPEQCLLTTLCALENAENIRNDQIVFEIVETEQVADYNHLKTILDYYQGQGFSVALDDMGSGYSTVEVFLQLKPNYIKVDMSIIRDIHKEEIKQLIFRNIVELAKASETIVLAEGIETVAELEYVRAHGAQLGQGFLWK